MNIEDGQKLMGPRLPDGTFYLRGRSIKKLREEAALQPAECPQCGGSGFVNSSPLPET